MKLLLESINEQEILAYAMDNEFLNSLLSLTNPPRSSSELTYEGTPQNYDTELFFAIHLAFRKTILNNHNKHPISLHEILVGGSKRGSDGNKQIISDRVMKNTIDNANYGEDGDAWGLVLGAWHFGLCNKNPHNNYGMTSSSIDNITDVGVNYIDLSMATWLPDFEYLDYVREHGSDSRYDPRNFELAYTFLDIR